MSESEFRDPRPTEKRNPRSEQIDVASSIEIVDLMHSEDKTVADAVHGQRREVASAIDLVARKLFEGGRLIYVGAGTSGRLGVLDASECPPTFGSDPRQVVGIIAGGPAALVRSQEGAEDDEDAARTAIADVELGEADIVVGIAASGSTPFVRAALRSAADSRAATGFITCAAVPDDVSDTCDFVIRVPVGPEVLTGSTRLKAGTATKLTLNMISTGAMLRLGKAYGNLMVDLQTTSDKLVDRGERIVMEVCGVDRTTAREVIQAASGSVKRAIVMRARGVTSEVADELLTRAGGILRTVIGDPPAVSE